MIKLQDIIQGDSKQILLEFTTNYTTPINLTDAIVTFTLRDLKDNIILQKIVTEHIDAVNGKTMIELTSNDTNKLKENSIYNYDIEFKKGNITKTILNDRIKVVKDVTP
jgi:hypothetical protein